MSQPVEQRAGQSLASEYRGPLVEREVAGDENRALFVALAEHFKKKFSADLGERDKA